jgi:hypothetical protein
MARADDAIGMAKPTVAARSRTAKHKLFMKFLKMKGLTMWVAQYVYKVGLYPLDAGRKNHTSVNLADFVVLHLF